MVTLFDVMEWERGLGRAGANGELGRTVVKEGLGRAGAKGELGRAGANGPPPLPPLPLLPSVSRVRRE